MHFATSSIVALAACTSARAQLVQHGALELSTRLCRETQELSVMSNAACLMGHVMLEADAVVGSEAQPSFDGDSSVDAAEVGRCFSSTISFGFN